MEIGDGEEQLMEPCALYGKVTARFSVVFLIFAVYLQVELGEGVYVPDAYVLLYARYQLSVSSCKDTEAQAWDTYETWDSAHQLTFETRMEPGDVLPILATVSFTD